MAKKLVEITQKTHPVEIALAYATPQNIAGYPIYRPEARCFLNEEAAELLTPACRYAEALGYHFRILDAFRPSEAQWKLWDASPNPEFLADPKRGSPHSMGAAIDLTLIETASGNELDFGTPFDDFTAQSHHGNQDISAEAQRNRHLLMGIMTTAGWDFYRNEWWHYQLFHARANWPVLSDAEASTEMMPET